MAMWNPWRGCHRYSEGCKFCYIHKGDAKCGMELVVVGGESDRFARPIYYDWVLDVREQCVRQNVSFEFRQCGTHFIKDSREYTLLKKDLCAQARKANINFNAVQGESL